MIENMIINGFLDVQNIMTEATKKTDDWPKERKEAFTNKYMNTVNLLMDEAKKELEKFLQANADPSKVADPARINELQEKLKGYATSLIKEINGNTNADNI